MSCCCSTSSPEFGVVCVLNLSHSNRHALLGLGMYFSLVIAACAMLRIILRHIMDLQEKPPESIGNASLPNYVFFPFVGQDVCGRGEERGNCSP